MLGKATLAVKGWPRPRGWGALGGEIGAGSLGKSGTYLRRTEGVRHVQGAPKNKKIYFWLTLGLVARPGLASLAITNSTQLFVSAPPRLMRGKATVGGKKGHDCR